MEVETEPEVDLTHLHEKVKALELDAPMQAQNVSSDEDGIEDDGYILRRHGERTPHKETIKIDARELEELKREKAAAEAARGKSQHWWR